MDIIFPKISGMIILQKIRKEYSSIELPVIMVTSKNETSDIVNALDAGASDFITKPFQIKIALARINTHLQIKEMSASLIKKNKRDAVAAMIATYNHEINNSLTII